MSIREQITAAVLTRLQTISVSNGYATKLGANAKRAERTFDECDLPACSLWVGNEESEPAHGITTQSMVAEIEAHSSTGNDSVDMIASRLLADIRKAMETYSAPLNALVESINYSSASPTYPDDGGGVVSMRVTYLITYSTVRGDPASNP